MPAIVLLLVQILFSGSFAFFTANLQLFPAITLFSLIQVATISCAMLALSSLSKSSRYVAILYAALIFFSQAMYGVLFLALPRGQRLSWVSMPLNLAQVGDFIFGLPPRSPFNAPVFVPFLMLALVVLASGVILERRVRGVEIVT